MPANIGSRRSPRSTRRLRKAKSSAGRTITISAATRSVRSRPTTPLTAPATSRTPSARRSASRCRSTSGARTASRSSRRSRPRSTRRASSSARSASGSRGPSATSECGQLKPVAGPTRRAYGNPHSGAAVCSGLSKLTFYTQLHDDQHVTQIFTSSGRSPCCGGSARGGAPRGRTNSRRRPARAGCRRSVCQ